MIVFRFTKTAETRSGTEGTCVSERGFCFTLQVSSIRMALRRFRFEAVAIRSARGTGKASPSFFATCARQSLISSLVGAETRIQTQRLRTGSITLHALLQTKINRQADVYFSIVLRKAAYTQFMSTKQRWGILRNKMNLRVS